MANIIPMAGLGTRFSKEGYKLPKPLIPVTGKPMIVRVTETLPATDKWIFIVRQEHIDEYRIDEILEQLIPEVIVVAVKKTTEGQASTCMLAMPYLDPDEPMFIASCDNSFLFDKAKFEELTNDPQIDAIVWTFTKNKLLSDSPKSWGWCVLADDGITINDMSVKIPVSGTPYDDHAVVATFYFKRAGDFKKAYELMVKENFRINNEFYVDSLPIFYNKLDLRSVIFDVDLYVGWGKPRDLDEYKGIEAKIKEGKSFENSRMWERFFDELPK